MVIDLEYCRKLDNDGKTKWPDFMTQKLLWSTKSEYWYKYNDMYQIKKLIEVIRGENNLKSNEFEKWFTDLNNKLKRT